MKGSMFSIALLLLGLAAVDGLALVGECVLGVTKFPVPCCPKFRGTMCGIGDSRGQCLQVSSSREEPPPNVMTDERFNLYNRFYNWSCSCKDNFFGPNCGDCKFGWTGEKCDRLKNLTRPNIMNMSPAALHRFHSMFYYCKNKIDDVYVILVAGDRLRDRSYSFKRASYLDMIIYQHHYATKPMISNGREINVINFAHGSCNFLGWHRYWMLWAEYQLQRCMLDETITIPFWAWEFYPDFPVCTDLYFGKSNLDGTLSQFSIYSDVRVMCAQSYSQTLCIQSDCVCQRPTLVRLAGLISGRRPRPEDLKSCLEIDYFDRAPFDGTNGGARVCYERVHNTFHALIGGVMSLVPVSASDPLFFMHHNNMDLHYERYIDLYKLGPNDYPDCNVRGHEPDACIFPSYPCWRVRDMMVPISTFGITFEGFTP